MGAHPGAVCANDEVGDDRSTIRESDGSGVVVDARAAGTDVSIIDTWRGWIVSLVIGDEFAWDAFAFLRGRGVKKTLVDILAVENVMYVTPSGIVVAQIGLGRYAAIPVTSNVFLKSDGSHNRDVNSPLPEPLGA